MLLPVVLIGCLLYIDAGYATPPQLASVPGSLWPHSDMPLGQLPTNLTRCHNAMSSDHYAAALKTLKVSMSIGDLTIEETEGDISSLSVFIQFNETWKDSKFATCMAEGGYNFPLTTFLDWMELSLVEFHSPRTQFNPGKFSGGHEIMTTVYPNGNIRFQFQGTFEFACVADSSNYPFDVQHCHITVSTDPLRTRYFDYEFGYVDYETDIQGSNEYRLLDVQPSSQTTELWKRTAGKQTDKTPVLLVDFRFVRNNHFEPPLFIGPGFLVVFGWVGFLLAPTAGCLWSAACFLVEVLYCGLMFQAFPPIRMSKAVLSYFSGCCGMLFVQVWLLALTMRFGANADGKAIIRYIRRKVFRSADTQTGTTASSATPGVSTTSNPYHPFDGITEKQAEAAMSGGFSDHSGKRSATFRLLALAIHVIVFVAFVIFWRASLS